MCADNDQVYFYQRAKAQLKMALQARTTKAASLHRIIAQAYLRRAASSGAKLASMRPGCDGVVAVKLSDSVRHLAAWPLKRSVVEQPTQLQRPGHLTDRSGPIDAL